MNTLTKIFTNEHTPKCVYACVYTHNAHARTDTHAHFRIQAHTHVFTLLLFSLTLLVSLSFSPPSDSISHHLPLSMSNFLTPSLPLSPLLESTLSTHTLSVSLSLFLSLACSETQILSLSLPPSISASLSLSLLLSSSFYRALSLPTLFCLFVSVSIVVRHVRLCWAFEDNAHRRRAAKRRRRRRRRRRWCRRLGSRLVLASGLQCVSICCNIYNQLLAIGGDLVLWVWCVVWCGMLQSHFDCIQTHSRSRSHSYSHSYSHLVIHTLELSSVPICPWTSWCHSLQRTKHTAAPLPDIW